MLQYYAWVKYLFKVHSRSMDFKTTKYKKFTNMFITN